MIKLEQLEAGARSAIQARDSGDPVKVGADTVRFDMDTVHECGTSACVAGFAALHAGYGKVGDWGRGIMTARYMAKEMLRTLYDGTIHGFGKPSQNMDLYNAMVHPRDPKKAPERVLEIIARIKDAK